MFVASALIAGPAHAGTDITWTWNSGDHDIEGTFWSYGDNYEAIEYNGDTFVDWSGSSGNGRWYIDGTAVVRKLDLNFKEGTIATMNVCQKKTGWPDDCSGKKYGVA